MRESVKINAIDCSRRHVSADDVGVQRAVAIASLQRAARVWRADQAIVDDAAVTWVGGIAQSIETEVVWRLCRVVDAAIRKINREVSGCTEVVTVTAQVRKIIHR